MVVGSAVMVNIIQGLNSTVPEVPVVIFPAGLEFEPHQLSVASIVPLSQ